MALKMTNKYNVVADLQNYMFSRTVVDIPAAPSLPLPPPPLQPLAPRPSPFFNPRMTDTLFWCFYVMKNGIVAYEQEPATFVKEKEEKIKYVLLIRNSKELLKKHKITKLIDIENNLSLEKNITIATFFALCILENVNAVILQNKPHVYSDICVNLTSGRMFVLNQERNRFKLMLDHLAMSELTYEKTHFKLPLKSISSYKLSELQDICSKLQLIVPAECKKKQDLYLLISNVLLN